MMGRDGAGWGLLEVMEGGGPMKNTDAPSAGQYGITLSVAVQYYGNFETRRRFADYSGDCFSVSLLVKYYNL